MRSTTFQIGLLTALAMSPLACDEGVGAPCEVDADCSAEMICDVHEGQGTCQEDHGHGEEQGDEHGHEHGTDEHGAEVDCEVETRADTFAVGLAKSGSSLTATFVSAAPAPPAMGDNAWVLAWTDADGMPVEELELGVTPWMPDHGHGTPIAASVAPTGNAGEYRVESLDLFMAGYWEITLDASAGELSDSLTFGFCVQ